MCLRSELPMQASTVVLQLKRHESLHSTLLWQQNPLADDKLSVSGAKNTCVVILVHSKTF